MLVASPDTFTETLVDSLEKLETLRGSRALLFACQDRPPFPKSFDDSDLAVLYDCLNTLGKVERLDLVLHSAGGKVTVTRRLYTLLRQYAQELTVFVPHKARSSATLLCLGANEIVMTPLSELGPLDPHISAASSGQGPAVLSAEDIRAYRAVAEEWFGITTEAHRMELFKGLSERIFPTTLSNFYRADKQMWQFACEFLTSQLPRATQAQREAVADKLVSGYFEHDYPIMLDEAAALGLEARASTTEEEPLLSALRKGYTEAFKAEVGEVGVPGGSREEHTNGLLVGTTFAARHLLTLERAPPAPAPGMTVTQHMSGSWQPLA